MNYRKAISSRLGGKTSHSSTAAVALALVGGIAVGAIISLLFAPQSGEETRHLIADKTKGLADGVKDRFRTAKDKMQQHAEDISDHVKDKYNSVKNGAQS
ncbi:YtxH domain-containing protein [Taibaiella koreensis]|uniref:YtxH domain-containing protein n=1 Tax=Taibaiella koreensis TaxID=1268548 RepID=UPI000E599A6E|nr:YtxH domain-containing protein [Taibaiella koreensis]